MYSSLPGSVERPALVYTVVKLGRTDQTVHADCNHCSEMAFAADILAAVVVVAENDYEQNAAHSSVIQTVRTAPVLDAAALVFAAAFGLASDRLDLASAYFESSAVRCGYAVAAPAAVVAVVEAVGVAAAYSLVRDAAASGVACVVVAVEGVSATERNVEAGDVEREVQHFGPSAVVVDELVAAALHSGPSGAVVGVVVE
mmetsp:Transcript_8489/g.21154  ORF Transcript_8489/g.21154 Transcript_8489/m.21154 type:complete len:200 (-) Transcript_8489:190-789(-)